MVEQLMKYDKLYSLSNISPETLWLHVLGDETKPQKIILQVINAKDHYSIQHSKLLGLFEGKDSRGNIEQVFGLLLQAFKQQQQTSRISTWLDFALLHQSSQVVMDVLKTRGNGELKWIKYWTNLNLST